MTNFIMVISWLTIVILIILISCGIFLVCYFVNSQKEAQMPNPKYSNCRSIWRQLKKMEKHHRYSVWTLDKYNKWFCLMRQYCHIVKKTGQWVSGDHFSRSFLFGHSTIFDRHISQCEKFISRLKKLEDAIWDELQNETDTKLYTLILLFLADVQTYRKDYLEKLLDGLRTQKAWLYAKENPPPNRVI